MGAGTRTGSKFVLGRLLITRGAAIEIRKHGIDGLKLLGRHARGDWGDLCPEDKHENELSLVKGWRLLSAYTIEGVKLWIITEADRSATTILLPEEY